MEEYIIPQKVSVVVQGAVDRKLTPVLLQSIRRFLPGAEIIISTWEGTPTKGLDCDRVVLSRDPGAICFDDPPQTPLNINRLLVSSQEGIAAATKPYILKCRSDLELIGDGFLYCYRKFPKREASLIVTEEKLVVGSLFSMLFEQELGVKFPMPYHLSDWYCFGQAQDVAKLFDVPIVDSTYTRWFSPKEKENPFIMRNRNRLWRFPPEQYLTLCMAKKALPHLNFPDCRTWQMVDLKEARRFAVSNFIILDPAVSGIVAQKAAFWGMSRDLAKTPPHIWDGLYRQQVYTADYKEFCDPTFVLPADLLLQRRRQINITALVRLRQAKELSVMLLRKAAKNVLLLCCPPLYRWLKRMEKKRNIRR